MAGRAVRERLAQDVGTWLTDGLISEATHGLLRERYAARGFGFAQAIKYLGISGGMLAFFGLLGLVGALAQSEGFAAFLLLAVGAGLTGAGLVLSMDARGRYGTSSKVVLLLGVVTATLGVGVALNSLELRSDQVALAVGALALPVVGYLAYRFRNLFLLILGLLGLFHWVGSWTSMFGRSGYGVEIQDPRLMCLAALAAIALGIFHERRLRPRTGRFYLAYQAVGLVYLNLSLLILTIDTGYRAERWGASPLFWMALFAAASLGQLVAGARLHNGLFTGFGVTTLCLNLYTRFFEHYWDGMHAGTFFLVGGGALFVAGAACEVLLGRMRAGAKGAAGAGGGAAGMKEGER